MQNENPDLHKFVYSEELVAMVSAANETTTFLEGLSGKDGKSFIEASVRLLPAVYTAILKIGTTTPVFENSGEPSVSEQDWSEVYKRIAGLLGGHNEILRPAEEDEFDRSDLVSHTISEDLADVYQELKDFISIYSRGMEELMNDAAWELKERFAEHWGKKLLRSLAALHELYTQDIDPAEKI